MFVDMAVGDYHLQSGSPCIDGGSNSAVPFWLTNDFEVDPRIVNGTVGIRFCCINEFFGEVITKYTQGRMGG